VEKNISEGLENEISILEYNNIKEINKDKLIEILHIFKNIDSDLIPLLEIIEKCLMEINDNKKATLIIKKLIKFYGINNNDILSTRQKFIIEDNKLIKKPFLKQMQKESINILLRDYGVL
jgi:hypothetical protein